MICAVPTVIVGPQYRLVQAVSMPWNDGSRCTASENFPSNEFLQMEQFFRRDKCGRSI